MTTHEMAHLALTVPLFDNNGDDAQFVPRVRAGLLKLGFDGWTEHRCELGAWRGEVEPVTEFVLYLPIEGINLARARIGACAREIMDDQEAIQLVRLPNVTLWEF